MNSTIHEALLVYWKSVMEQCQARPKGQTARQWLVENNISENQYYYWLRKLLKEGYALESDFRSHSALQDTVLAKNPFTVREHCKLDFHPDAVIRTSNISIELSNSVSVELFEKLMEGIPHA